MEKEFNIAKELKQIDRDITNGLDVNIPRAVGNLIRRWVKAVGEETTYCSDDERGEFDAWIIPDTELRKLPGRRGRQKR